MACLEIFESLTIVASLVSLSIPFLPFSEHIYQGKINLTTFEVLSAFSM